MNQELKVALHHRTLQRRRLNESEVRLERALDRFKEAKLTEGFSVMGGWSHLQVLNTMLDDLRGQATALVYWSLVCASMQGQTRLDGSE